MVEPIRDPIIEEMDKVNIRAKAKQEYDALMVNKIGEDPELEHYEEKDSLLIQSIIPHWTEGRRNQICMDLSGFLRKNHYTQKHTSSIIRNICEATDDKDYKERLSTIAATYKKPIENIRGYTGLKDLIPEEALKNYKEKKKEEKEIRTSSIYQDNKLYEQIYSPETRTSLFMSVNSKAKTTTHLYQGETIILPIIGEELDKEAVLLPTGIEEYGSLKELLIEIKEYIHKYVDINIQFETFSAWYILLTWIYDRLDTINYMRVMGDTGLGKTRYLEVVGKVCYKPIIVAGAVGVAPIFRLIEKWSGTLIIDEADFGNSDEKEEIVKILNCGFQRGTPVVRCDKNDPNKIMFFKVYCPKIISTRRAFEDKALESRCLTHKVYMTNRKDMPDSLGTDFTKKQKSLRNKLLKFRFDNYNKIVKDENLSFNLGDIEPRLKQATRSFAAMFSTDEKALEEFRSFLLRYNQELIQERSGSFDGDVVNGIYELLRQGQIDISSQDVLDYMKAEKVADDRTNVRSIGKRLSSLNIITKNRRVGNKTKHFIDFSDWDVLNRVFARYIPDYDCGVVSFVSTIRERVSKTQQTLDNPKKENDTNDTNDTNKNLLSPYTLTQTTHETDLELPKEEYLKGIFSDGEVIDWVRRNPGCSSHIIQRKLEVSYERLVDMREKGLLFESKPDRWNVI